MSYKVDGDSDGEVSSGTTAKATTSDAAVEVLPAVEKVMRHLRIVNVGTVAGFYSRDGGTTWNYLPAGTASGPTAIMDRNVCIYNQAVQVKRVAGGSNLSGVYASAW